MSPIGWTAIAGGILAAGTAVLLVLAARGSLAHTCEVCMTFHGRTDCRTASGTSAEEARRTAIDNVCAVLGARGMSESIECQNTAPASVSCSD